MFIYSSLVLGLLTMCVGFNIEEYIDIKISLRDFKIIITLYHDRQYKMRMPVQLEGRNSSKSHIRT